MIPMITLPSVLPVISCANLAALIAARLSRRLWDLADVSDPEILVPLALGVEQDDKDPLILCFADVVVERGGVDPGKADGVRLRGDRLPLQLDRCHRHRQSRAR